MRICTAVLSTLLLCGCIPPTAKRGYAATAPAPLEFRQDAEIKGQSAPADQQVQRLPAPPPAWEVRPVTPDARRIPASTLIVTSRDTIGGIALATGASVHAIARANNLQPPYRIVPGQKLVIPAGRYHLVRSGETGIAIARAYDVSWSEVIAANDLEEPFILRAGQRLLIPEPKVDPIEQRAARFHVDIDDIVTGGQPAVASRAKPVLATPGAARVLPATTPVAPPARFAGGFAWPVRGTVVGRFGPRPGGERNDGVQIAVPANTPIHASADGVVAYVGSEVPSLGGIVILQHGNGWASVYGHASKLLVQRGQSVKQGETIALAGASGGAPRTELHFELRQGRTPVDPLTKLPRQ